MPILIILLLALKKDIAGNFVNKIWRENLHFCMLQPRTTDTQIFHCDHEKEWNPVYGIKNSANRSRSHCFFLVSSCYRLQLFFFSRDVFSVIIIIINIIIIIRISIIMKLLCCKYFCAVINITKTNGTLVWSLS